MAQRVKGPVLPLLQLRFRICPENFHMPWGWPKTNSNNNNKLRDIDTVGVKITLKNDDRLF